MHQIKGLSNVKEEVYGALDSFIAWDLEFPLITVKKALKALEHEKEWKRIIQVKSYNLVFSFYILWVSQISFLITRRIGNQVDVK